MIKEFPYDSVSQAINSFAVNEIKAHKLKFDPKAPAYMQLSNYLSKLIKKNLEPLPHQKTLMFLTDS